MKVLYILIPSSLNVYKKNEDIAISLSLKIMIA